MYVAAGLCRCSAQFLCAAFRRLVSSVTSFVAGG